MTYTCIFLFSQFTSTTSLVLDARVFLWRKIKTTKQLDLEVKLKKKKIGQELSMGYFRLRFSGLGI